MVGGNFIRSNCLYMLIYLRYTNLCTRKNVETKDSPKYDKVREKIE